MYIYFPLFFELDPIISVFNEGKHFGENKKDFQSNVTSE